MLGAATLIAVGRLAPRRARDLFALAAAVATTAVCVRLLLESASGADVYWFGGFRPVNGMATGITFVVDPAAAALALMAALSASLSLLYSWHYFEDVRGLYHALILAFLTGMIGVALTGDLFNLFVFLELMGLAAFALTAEKIEEPSLTGSLAFAIVNTLGALFLLAGVSLLYGITRALNFAQVGRMLAAVPPGSEIVIVALGLVATGLLIKAAIAPFHFWLTDAYAVAPTPIAALFASAMLELGLYLLIRLWATVFSGAVPGETAMRALLLGLGTVSAVLGAIMALRQRHLKRMLAFITVSHAGVLLCGMALLEAKAIGGAGIYLLADGAVRCALFFAAGVLLHREGTLDEMELRANGRGLPGLGLAFLVAGITLAGAPGTGVGLGKALMEEAAARHGSAWIVAVFVAVSALTAAALLRVAGRIFLGWGGPTGAGTAARDDHGPEGPETEGPARTVPRSMALPIALMLTVAVVPGLIPGLHEAAGAAGRWFLDPGAYSAAVMDDLGTGPALSFSRSAGLGYTGKAIALGVAGVVLAGVVAAILLAWERMPERIRRLWDLAVAPFLRGLDKVHTQHVGDYVAWAVAGCAIILLGLSAAF
jgi:multicomponent Na+:H+ antiporter subunit D